MNSLQTGIEQCTNGYINGTDPRIEMKMPSGSKLKATNREVRNDLLQVKVHEYKLSHFSFSFFIPLSFRIFQSIDSMQTTFLMMKLVYRDQDTSLTMLLEHQVSLNVKNKWYSLLAFVPLYLLLHYLSYPRTNTTNITSTNNDVHLCTQFLFLFILCFNISWICLQQNEMTNLHQNTHLSTHCQLPANILIHTLSE